MDRHHRSLHLSVWIIVSVLSAACIRPAPQAVGASPEASAQSAVDRGKYLVTVQDCNGCHTPFTDKGEPDMSRMLSGHPQGVSLAAPPKMPIDGTWLVAINTTNTAWAGPWGVSFTTNLTPDRRTGIGAWTERTFISAIREGKKGGIGRTLLPPMPWRMYASLTDDDLAAIFAYLRTIPAIQNQVPNAIPPAAPPSE